MRMPTFTRPSGVGKLRLALVVVRAIQHNHVDGAALVDVSLTGPEGAARACDPDLRRLLGECGLSRRQMLGALDEIGERTTCSSST